VVNLGEGIVADRSAAQNERDTVVTAATISQ